MNAKQFWAATIILYIAFLLGMLYAVKPDMWSGLPWPFTFDEQSGIEKQAP